MKITSSDIAMASSHSLFKKDEVSEELRLWIGEPPGDSQEARSFSPSLGDKVALSEKAKAKLTLESKAAQPEELDDPVAKDEKLYLIKLLVEAITGKKIKLLKMSALQENTEPPKAPDAGQAAQPEGQEREGWGMTYNYRETHVEREKLFYRAKGTVTTADGQEITFSIHLKLKREFTSEESISLRAGDAVKVDPLVINFNGSAAELTNMKFDFDLDADGDNENISFVAPGSGFLAFDKNEDGIINNGAELFGPQTGNGFTELAEYDEDKNNWIDESDSIYDKLLVWTKDAEGNDALRSLGDAGVGAIGLQNIQTLFDLKDAANNLDGQLVRTGIFLGMDSTAGTIQQIDMVA